MSEQQPSVLGSSAVMAAGTVVSRLTGFVRNSLLVAALGTALHADVFNIANTIPNMLYILLAGGVFNAVLVPQLVRAMRSDADGGEAYTNRLITLALVFLVITSVVLVLFAPQLMRLFLDGSYFTPQLTPQREAAITFARFCLPQVFFYGMFVLVGQVLNARGVFGPMMWAPIANNVIAVAVLITYLVAVGPASGIAQCGGYSAGAVALLGIGSTVGIAVQLLVLLPYLRSAGFRFSARFDFRGSGLGHTLRLGTWTVLFVVVNQIAFTVVVRLASHGTAQAACTHPAAHVTGYTIYSSAYLLIIVPHSIITVSLGTALLPRLSAYAAEGNLAALGTAIGSALRSAYAVMLPVIALLPVLAYDISQLAWAYGAGRHTASNFVPTLSLFAVWLFFFTTHYLMLRGLYALEQTRRAFFIQSAIAVVNIVLAVVLTRGISPDQTSPRLVVAYAGSFVVGAVASYLLLAREVGGLDSRRLLRFMVRLGVVVGIATAGAALTRVGMHSLVGVDGKLQLLASVLVTGLVDVVLVLVLAKATRITEVTEITSELTRRFVRRTPR